jgi:hypothetical protein
MKICLQCNEPLYRTAKEPICLACRKQSKCACGRKKDWRAKRCQPCDGDRLSDAAKQQWQTMRPKMLAQLEKACIRRRRKLHDLEWKHFRETKKEDGRYFTRYWDEAGKYRAIYRYQWMWIQHHGPIPKGYHVHHKDHDPTNDAIENLELLSEVEHHKLHGAEMHMKGAKWRCQHCGQEFYRSPRGETGVRKYCSQDCHYAHKRGMPIAQVGSVPVDRIQ